MPTADWPQVPQHVAGYDQLNHDVTNSTPHTIQTPLSFPCKPRHRSQTSQGVESDACSTQLCLAQAIQRVQPPASRSCRHEYSTKPWQPHFRAINMRGGVLHTSLYHSSSPSSSPTSQRRRFVYTNAESQSYKVPSRQAHTQL